MNITMIRNVTVGIFTILAFCAMLAGGNFFEDLFSPSMSHRPVFHETGFLHATETIGLFGIDGHITAFGDFNNDKYTDLLVISSDASRISLYQWSHDLFKFYVVPDFIINDVNIKNAIPGDFNQDGRLDVLVTGLDADKSYYIHIWFRGTNNPNHVVEVTPNSKDEVMVLDSNADMSLDILGTPVGSDRPTFWVNSGDGTAFNLVALTEEGDTRKLSSPTSNGFVDFNGDCVADLILGLDGEKGPVYEIWLNEKGRFTFSKRIYAPAGAQKATFSDVDGDGATDIVFAVCDPFPSCSAANSIHILYNKQTAFCKSASPLASKLGCRSLDDLCIPDPDFTFSEIPSEDDVVVEGDVFLGYKLYSPPGADLSLRFGDYNLDGYPDILVPLAPPSTKSLKKRLDFGDHGNEVIIKDAELKHSFYAIFQNVPCTAALCDPSFKKGKRTFVPLGYDLGATKDSTLPRYPFRDDLSTITDAVAATFFDLDEDGVLDILVLCDSSSNSGKNKRDYNKNNRAIVNNMDIDAYFLKVLGSNGVCPAWCPGKKFPETKPYGVNYPGGTFKFTVTETSGEIRVTTGSALSQSSPLSLQTPYIVFGLGRTNDYIQILFYGVPVKNSGDIHYSSQVCIVPNAQVVAFPYPLDHPEEWKIELYVSPSGFTLWVVVAIFFTVVLLALIIFFLHQREKAQDEMEKKKMAHLFSFDAL
eukprot:TRINITY_DN128_c0_g1_i1.p1 TRINITY_DN128_c0_g1~~TRINITY_DN128_c0_g1_i1.p1  ORF type:complete len:701 (-),score=215.46 TRINITY_DN128_c0_g1_i1:81-2183(-)